MRDRAFRRYKSEVKKQKIKRVWSDTDLTENQKWVCKMAITSKPCSCYACGNPRKWFDEKTVQEYIFESKEIFE